MGKTKALIINIMVFILKCLCVVYFDFFPSEQSDFSSTCVFRLV